MKGAREYAKLFKTGQYGQLYIVSSSHPRGLTFNIQILPKGEKAIPNGINNLCLNKNAVEVYGIISGQPGWTEEYGWKYKGKWQEDFEKLVRKRKLEIKRQEQKKQNERKIALEKEKERIKNLLSNY